MPSNLDTLQQLKITLARWKAPSAWDVVQQDEPLDKPKGEWVPTTAANVSTSASITIPAGIALSNTSGGTYVITATVSTIVGGNDLAHRQWEIARLYQDGKNERAIVHAIVREGTGSGQQGLYPETAYGQGNLLPRGGILPEGRLPYPRNRKELRTYESIKGRQLHDLLRMAERKLGPRAGSNTEEWNAGFWEMFTRTHVADERRKTRK
jgi:hypothetical protein